MIAVQPTVFRFIGMATASDQAKALLMFLQSIMTPLLVFLPVSIVRHISSSPWAPLVGTMILAGPMLVTLAILVLVVRLGFAIPRFFELLVSAFYCACWLALLLVVAMSNSFASSVLVGVLAVPETWTSIVAEVAMLKALGLDVMHIFS
jgi:hypothetical protein